MKHRWLAGLLLSAFGLCGCEEFEEWSRSASSRNNIPPLEKLPRAPSDVSTRVDSVGRMILAANKEIVTSLMSSDPDLQRATATIPNFDFKPQFVAIGVPGVALYHQRGEQVQVVVVSAGLVNRCPTDSELAAVLCSELAKMVAEAQAQTAAKSRERINGDRPYTPSVGSDTVSGRTPDATAQAEQAVYERKNPRPIDRNSPMTADPAGLARSYMTNLNGAHPDQRINPNDLTKVEPLVRQGNANPNFQGIVTTGPASGQPVAPVSGSSAPSGSGTSVPMTR